MAPILRAGVQLNDGMSPTLRRIVSATASAVSEFRHMQAASGRPIDTSGLRAAEAELKSLSRELDRVSDKQGRMSSGGAGGGFMGGFMGGMGKLGGVVTALNQGMQLLGGAASAALAPIKGIAELGMSRAGAIEGAEATLKGLHHTGAEISSIMDSAKQSVLGTAYGLGDAGKVAASAVAAGIPQGKELTRYLTLTADAASITGRSMSDMGAIFNKVAANGKMSAQEINQLADAGLPIRTLLADNLGLAVEEVNELVSAGKVGVAELQAAIESGMGGAATQVTTFEAGVENAKAALGRLGAAALGPLREIGKDALAALIPMIDQITTSLQPIFDTFAETVGPAIQQTIEALEPLIPLIQEIMGNAAQMVAETLNAALPFLPPLLELFMNLTLAFQGLLEPLTGNREGFYILAMVLGGILFAGMVAIMTVVTVVASVFYSLQGAVLAVKAAILFLSGDLENSEKALKESRDAADNARDAWVRYADSVGQAANALADFKVQADAANSAPKGFDGSAAAGITGTTKKAAAPKTPAAPAAKSGGYAGQTARNTKKTADNTAKSKEDLKYLRDVASRKAVNRFTTAQLNLNFTNTNNVSGSGDVDGVTQSVYGAVVRAMQAAAEA
jgi:tape measure domain-containing protein